MGIKDVAFTENFGTCPKLFTLLFLSSNMKRVNSSTLSFKKCIYSILTKLLVTLIPLDSVALTTCALNFGAKSFQPAFGDMTRCVAIATERG